MSNHILEGTALDLDALDQVCGGAIDIEGPPGYAEGDIIPQDYDPGMYGGGANGDEIDPGTWMGQGDYGGGAVVGIGETLIGVEERPATTEPSMSTKMRFGRLVGAS